MTSSSLYLLDLPTDILVEILQYSEVLPLACVCRGFWDVIYSTSSFWSSINIDENRHVEEAKLFLSKRLERSAACPLTVSIRMLEDSLTPADEELLDKLSSHKDRIRDLHISTGAVTMAGTIMDKLLLTPQGSTTLRKLQFRDIGSKIPRFFERDGLDPQVFLENTPTHFPFLTTLALPIQFRYVPHMKTPILFLQTLILYGTFDWMYTPYQVAQLIVKTPNIETLWCKHQSMRSTLLPTINSKNEINLDFSSHLDDLSIQLPILLPGLKNLSIAVPGLGANLLHVIHAPALLNLHMDGTRDDNKLGEMVSWKPDNLDSLHTSLNILALRSPELRRIALVKAYLLRNTWEWLFGLEGEAGVPFPLLESVAIRGLEEVKDEVTNTFNDQFLERYVEDGRVILRRFAYLASEPQLSGWALDQLVNASRKTKPKQLFEVELDRSFSEDTKSWIDDLLLQGVKAILHKEPIQLSQWWTLVNDIDATEADSY